MLLYIRGVGRWGPTEEEEEEEELGKHVHKTFFFLLL
jgi:hypothetical protein